MKRHVMLYINRDTFDHHFIEYWAVDEDDCLRQHSIHGQWWRCRPGNNSCQWVIRSNLRALVVGQAEMPEWVEVARREAR